MTRLISLRHRMVGAQVRQARLGAGLSAEKIAEYLGVDAAQVQAYELGKTPIPLPHLEMLSGLLNRSIREFYDRHGPVGEWTTQRRAVEDFLRIPLELQEFVSKPINRPYLELAQRLSEMSVDKLRAVAEGLLEITY
jgi:transcriptional regulator with XRE-family HTH domain